MTTPWKTWMRSRLPSTTRTCTLTVSPGRNSGRSSRRLSASMVSVGCMGASFGSGRWAGSDIVAVFGEQLHLPDLGQEGHLLAAQPPSGLDEVGAPAHRAGQGLGPPPAPDAAVVARAEHLGDGPAPELGR